MADLPIGGVLKGTWKRFVASPGDFLILAFLATAVPLAANALVLYTIAPGLALESPGGGVGAVFSLAGLLLQHSMVSFQTDLVTGLGLSDRFLFGTVASLLVGTVLSAYFGGALVAEALDDPDEAGAGRSLRRSLSHLVPLVVGGIVIAVITLGLLFPGLGLLVRGGVVRSLTLVAAGFLAVVVGFVVLIYLLIALFLWRAVIVAEDAGAVEALRRSWDLTRGNRLALFVVVLVVGLATGVVAALIQVPFTLGAGVAAFGGNDVGARLARSIGIVLAGTVTGAFMPIVAARVYADLSGRQAPEGDEVGPSPPEGYVPVDPGA